MRTFVLLALLGAPICAPLAGATNEPAKRLADASTVLSEIMATPDKGIPQDLMDKAQCIVVVPAMKKGAFIFGAQYGKGFLSCRRKGGEGWSAPAAVRIEGGSFGLQIGGAETDLVMLVMNKSGEDKLLSSEFTLGAGGEVAVGPVGRSTTAQTDALMRAEILSWSRARGVFAGIALKGATLRQDLDDNEALYGKKLENREIVTSGMRPPKSAELISLLDKYSPHEKENAPAKNTE